MYAHPSFLRNRPESLLQLRKITPARGGSHCHAASPPRKSPPAAATHLRPVSPSTANSVGSHSDQDHHEASDHEQHHAVVTSGAHGSSLVIPFSPDRPTLSSSTPVSPPPTSSLQAMMMRTAKESTGAHLSPRFTIDDRGKLDLLALALERATGGF